MVEPDSVDVKNGIKRVEYHDGSAKGQSVIVHLNSYETAEINNDSGRNDGYIALQLHGGEDMLVSFKDIAIKIYLRIIE